MLSGRRLSVHPVASDGGALNDCGSSWNLAAPDMDYFFGPAFGPHLAPVLTSEGREYVMLANWRGVGVSSR